MASNEDATLPVVGPPFPLTAPPFAPGAHIGRYLVVGQLGQGGMGVVYRAYDPELDRTVAVKVLKLGDAGAAAQQRLLLEAQAMARLSHPNVVQVHDAGTVDGQVFLTMELVAGGTLREWLAERPRSAGEILAVFRQAGAGLAAAHRAGIAHRDFKPGNVLVTSEGVARVSDFGLARTWSDGLAAPGAQDETTLRGTPAYMAPEQFRGEAGGPASDQFSFAVALFGALHGGHPFGGAWDDFRQGVIAGPPHFPGDPRVPRWIRPVLVRALAPDPNQRFPSMDALLAALSRSPSAWRRWAVVALIAGAAAVAGGLHPVRALMSCGGSAP